LDAETYSNYTGCSCLHYVAISIISYKPSIIMPLTLAAAAMADSIGMCLLAMECVRGVI